MKQVRPDNNSHPADRISHRCVKLGRDNRYHRLVNSIFLQPGFLLNGAYTQRTLGAFQPEVAQWQSSRDGRAAFLKTLKRATSLSMPWGGPSPRLTTSGSRC